MHICVTNDLYLRLKIMSMKAGSSFSASKDLGHVLCKITKKMHGELVKTEEKPRAGKYRSAQL